MPEHKCNSSLPVPGLGNAVKMPERHSKFGRKFSVYFLFLPLVRLSAPTPCRRRLDGQGGADWGLRIQSLVQPWFLNLLSSAVALPLLPPFSTNPPSLTFCLSISPTSTKKKEKKNAQEEAWLCAMNSKGRGSLRGCFPCHPRRDLSTMDFK